MSDIKKINVNNTSYDIKDETARNGLSSKYDTGDTAETTLADDDKIPFYDTSASGRRNSTWANIKAKLKAYFDTLYGTVTGVKGDGESTYRTGNVNITAANVGAVPATTYEYNKEISFGSSGKLLIGKFPCYDSNVTITISATTSTTYHCTAILATQNINTSGGGTFTWRTYGDSSNSVTPNLYAKYASGSNVIEIYFSPTNWSKNLVHIQCNALSGTPTNICENVSSIPSEANRQPTNTLTSMNTTGSSGSCTGNAATATTASSCSGNSATATKATQDSDGNAINTTYMKKGVDYVTAGRKENTTAGTKSTAEGNNTTASGNYSHAEGDTTSANNVDSHAEGYLSTVYGDYSHAEGNATTVYGKSAHAEGGSSYAYSDYSHAEGYSTQAGTTSTSGQSAYRGEHAEGYNTNASGTYGAHAEGYSTTASGVASHAEGESTTASHRSSHAEGYGTQTGTSYQHVMGKFNVGKSTTYFEIGDGTSASARKNIFEIDTTGNIRTPYAAALESTGNKLIMIKIGRVVICNFYGFPCSSYSQASVGPVELIDLAHAEYRPMYGQCGLGFIYANENANYVCTIDLLTDGKMFVRYKGAISTRSAGIANTYGMYANLCWITAA